MKLKSILLQGFLLSTGSLCLFAGADSFQLKNGDRVVFYGDSITDQRLYTTFTESYVLTRFPKWDVTFVHSGWGGDRVTGGGGGPIDVRLERDVFPYHPNVLTVMLGMNDGRYRAFNDADFEVYTNGLVHIVDSVKEHLPGIRITLIEPSPYDDVNQSPRFEGGYNAVLVRYGDFVKELAEKDNCTVADLNAPLVGDLEKAKESDPELAKKIIPDRVHPGPAGHLLMAEQLLKAWKAPSVVTAVEIDAEGKEVKQSEGTHVSKLAHNGELTWTQEDEALPMPIDPKDPLVALALHSSDFLSALDREPLKVTGLEGEKYQLKIDGTAVGEFSKEQLADGVNLATLETPMLKQAQAVHRLTLEHNQLHFARWRQVQVPLANLKTDAERKAIQNLIDTLDREESELIARQHAAAQPKEHTYELVAE